MKIIFNPFEEANKLAVENGDWVVAVVETQVFWPKLKQTVLYEGKDYLLLPLGEPTGPFATRQLPAIALRADSYGLSRENARKSIMQFASALSWREGAKIDIVGWGGGNLPRSMGIIRNNAVTDYLDGEHLPSPQDDRARAALAFYREGVSLDNPFYSFLSFYKAFSVAVSEPQSRGQWIFGKRGEITRGQAKERLDELERDGNEVGNYLYQAGRNAIAHADREPFVNPDDADDHFRLSRDAPLMRAFAELAIEERFGVKRKTTIYREHLYELEGFRKVIPEEAINAFKDGRGTDLTFQVDLPEHFLVVARKGPEQHALRSMKIVTGQCFDHGVVMDFRSNLEVVTIRVILNFADEKLEFDPLRHISVSARRDDSDGVLEEIAALEAMRCILSNGHLEIWNPEGERLGASEGYLPMNAFVNVEYFEAELRNLKGRLEELRSA
jgi:hypothetical protein